MFVVSTLVVQYVWIVWVATVVGRHSSSTSSLDSRHGLPSRLG
jgi:hypothetical protein